MQPEFPSSKFFLEYVARPQTAEVFFEDVLMAIAFYGMPILAENIYINHDKKEQQKN